MKNLKVKGYSKLENKEYEENSNKGKNSKIDNLKTWIIALIFTLIIFCIIIYIYFKDEVKLKEMTQTKISTNNTEDKSFELKLNNQNEKQIEKIEIKNETIINEIKNTKNETIPKIGICISTKNDNRYIKEFVEYHKKIGVYRIYIYDNNPEEERVEKIIKKYVDSGFVKILFIDTPNFQHVQYNDCIKKFENEVDWLGFIDTDEHFYIESGMSFPDFVSLEQFKNCNLIIFNWMIYDDNDLIYYEDKPLEERFTRSTLKWHYFAKSLLRTSFHLEKLLSIHITAPIQSSCNAKGDHVGTIPGQVLPEGLALTNYAFVKHFQYKTVEEYVQCYTKHQTTTKISKEQIARNFFNLNKITEEKIKFLENYYSINLNDLRSKIGKLLTD